MHKPFEGYTFSVIKHREIEGKKLPLFRSDKTHKFKWDKAEFDAPEFNSHPGLLATPLDPAQPSFLFAWGSLQSKHLDGEAIDALPSDLWQTWKQVKLANYPEAGPDPVESGLWIGEVWPGSTGGSSRSRHIAATRCRSGVGRSGSRPATH